jgi:uncharacterized membrane protein
VSAVEFSYKIMWLKGIKYFVVFALPFLVDQFIFAMPEIASISIGSCLLMLVNILKAKYGMRLP